MNQLSTCPLAGAVASMFWVDAELGSDIYLDGKIFLMIIINTFAIHTEYAAVHSVLPKVSLG